jgi:hypothetical protein
VKRRIRPIASKIDALVVVSCPGGVKSANLCNPGVPVIAACDSLGSNPQFPRGDTRTGLVLSPSATICTDGYCVLSYTAGICPVSECPRKTRYGPCPDFPDNSDRWCVIDPERSCVWKVIGEEVARRGENLEILEDVERMHNVEDYQRLPAAHRDTPASLKLIFGKLASRISVVVKFVIRWTD